LAFAVSLQTWSLKPGGQPLAGWLSGVEDRVAPALPAGVSGFFACSGSSSLSAGEFDPRGSRRSGRAPGQIAGGVAAVDAVSAALPPQADSRTGGEQAQ